MDFLTCTCADSASSQPKEKPAPDALTTYVDVMNKCKQPTEHQQTSKNNIKRKVDRV